jgi:hypothetical protein
MPATVCERPDCQAHPEVILTDTATGTATTHSESHAWALLDVPAGTVTVARADEPAPPAEPACICHLLPAFASGRTTGHWSACPVAVAELATEPPTGTVTVALSCTYVCGREWETTVTVPAPPEGAAGSALDEFRGEPWQLADWWDDVVRPHMGDGHRCGPRTCESYDEATITAAPGRPELVDRGQTWQG